MRFFVFGALCAATTLGCGGNEFSTLSGAPSTAGRDSGPSGNGGTPSAGGGRTNGGTNGNGGAGAVGNGGTSAGGSSGNGGASDGGTVGNGGTNAGGMMSAGGVGAGGGGGAVDGGVPGPDGAPKNSGDCAIGRADCHNGTRCTEVTPGGYRVCAQRYSEAATCTALDPCCKTADCPTGAICYEQPVVPQCGGIVVIGGNVCASDQCTSDSACGNAAICAPVGTFENKVRTCVSASCHFDTDCTKQLKGICAPVSGGCCNNPLGLHCVYPNSGCRNNADCVSQNCEIDQTGASFCSTDPLICPQ